MLRGVLLPVIALTIVAGTVCAASFTHGPYSVGFRGHNTHFAGLRSVGIPVTHTIISPCLCQHLSASACACVPRWGGRQVRTQTGRDRDRQAADRKEQPEIRPMSLEFTGIELPSAALRHTMLRGCTIIIVSCSEESRCRLRTTVAERSLRSLISQASKR